MYKAENIDVVLGDKTIVKNASAKISPGKISVLIGPNGAGKSTLLKAMTGELDYSNGKVSINDIDIAEMSEADLAVKRAVLPQSSSLSFPFTVFEVVKLGLLGGYSGLTVEEKYQIPEQALEKVGLPGFGGKYFQVLSGGEQQRVHLARVLCQVWKPVLGDQPRYLFLDEPIANLDMLHQLLILQLAKKYAMDGGGVLAVLHDLNIAAMYADEIIAMKDGKVICQGKPETVFTDNFMKNAFDLPVNVSQEPSDNTPYMLPQTVNIKEIFNE